MPAFKHSNPLPPPEPAPLWSRIKDAGRAVIAPTPPAAEPPTVAAAPSSAAEPPKPVGISDEAVARICGGTISPDDDRLMRSMFRPGNGF